MKEADNLSSGAAMQHLDEMSCLLYIERQLDQARAQEVSAHTQECAACRTLLRALERESRLLTRAMLEEEEALLARLAQFQERARRSMHSINAKAVAMTSPCAAAARCFRCCPTPSEASSCSARTAVRIPVVAPHPPPPWSPAGRDPEGW